MLSVEAAGAGFAAAVANAPRYAGQEISSTQALVDAGIEVPEPVLPDSEVGPEDAAPGPVPGAAAEVSSAARDWQSTITLCARVRQTLQEQVAGWKDRSFFERQ